MVGFLKSLQSVLSGVLADLPDGVKVLTEFLWRVRWFLMFGLLFYIGYQVALVVLPYLLWTFVLKQVLGVFLPFLF